MARLSLLLLLAASLGVAHAAEQEVMPTPTVMKAWTWTDCGTEGHRVHVKDIEVTPDPPKRGQDLTVHVLGSADEVIEDGAYADVTVKVGAIKILHKEFDLCDEMRNANTSIQCPVREGSHEVTQTVTLPKEIPPAQFTANVRGYTVDDEDLLCLDLVMDFRPGRRFGFF